MPCLDRTWYVHLINKLSDQQAASRKVEKHNISVITTRSYLPHEFIRFSVVVSFTLFQDPLPTYLSFIALVNLTIEPDVRNWARNIYHSILPRPFSNLEYGAIPSAAFIHDILIPFPRLHRSYLQITKYEILHFLQSSTIQAFKPHSHHRWDQILSISSTRSSINHADQGPKPLLHTEPANVPRRSYFNYPLNSQPRGICR